MPETRDKSLFRTRNKLRLVIGFLPGNRDTEKVQNDLPFKKGVNFVFLRSIYSIYRGIKTRKEYLMLTGFESVSVELTPKLKTKAIVILENLEKYTSAMPVKSQVIEKGMKMQGTQVRACISWLRCNEYLIGSNQNGYYKIQTQKELEETQAQIKERIQKLLAVYYGLERGRKQLINNPELFGQKG